MSAKSSAEFDAHPRGVMMRNGQTANVWLLEPPHWCYDFKPAFALRGRVQISPHHAVHQWRLDGRWDNLAEHEFDLMLPVSTSEVSMRQARQE